MSSISNELNYQQSKLEHSQLKMTKLLPQNGSQTVTVSGGGGQQSIFEIPSEMVMNLAQSKLYYNRTVGDGLATYYNWFIKDCVSEIASIQLMNRAGVYLCDIPYCNTYTKVVCKPETTFEHFMKQDIGGRTTHEGGVCNVLRRSNSFCQNATHTIEEPFARRANNAQASMSFTAPQYIEAGTAVGDGAGAGDVTITRMLTLGDAFKNTILACNKSLYFGETLLLRITYAPVDRIAFKSTDANDPNAAGKAAIIADVTLDSLSLFLATETNQNVINSLKQKAQSGYSILTPYVYGYKTSLGGSSKSVSLRFNRGNAKRLMKVYTALFGPETTNTMYDHDNTAGAKVTSYYTLLQNQRIQEFNVSCGNTQYEDWLINEKNMDGSVIQGSSMYKHNWFHLDKWSGEKLHDSDALFNVASGLPLDQEQKYDIYLTTPIADHNIFNFAITQRTISVGPAGLVIE